MLLSLLADATAATAPATQAAKSVFDLPATTWGMIGSLAAAFVAGVISLVHLMSNKEQHVAEITRHWLEELMADLGKFLGSIELILKLHEVAEIKNPPDMNAEELRKLRTENKTYYHDLHESYYRVLLRLDHDSPEHREITKTLNEVRSAFFGPCGNIKTIDACRASLVEKNQALSREVWEGIKRGDRGYRNIQKILIVMIVVSVVGMAVITFALWHGQW